MTLCCRAFCAVFLASCLSCFVVNSASAAPAVEAFGSLPVIQSANLSPDGKHLAVLGPVNGRNAVTVFTLDAADVAPSRAAFPDADAVGIHWANDNRLICIFKANVKRSAFGVIEVFVRAISVAMDGSPAVVLMHDTPFFSDSVGSGNTGAIVDQDPADPDHIYMVAYESDAQMSGSQARANPFTSDMSAQSEKFTADTYFLNYFKVDVATGDTDMVAHGSAQTIQYVTDGQGHVIGRIDRTSDLVDHYLLGGHEMATYDVSRGDKLNIEGVAFDGSALLASAYDLKSGRLGLYAYKFGAADLGAPLFQDPTYDLGDTIRDDLTGRVIGMTWRDDRDEFKYFDPVVEHVRERIAHALAGQTVAVISRDKANANFVIRAEGPKNPTTFYLFNAQNGQLSLVGSAYPALQPGDLGEEKAYVYKSKDGTDIHAYLTLPPGKVARNLPTVILPHGGPEDRDAIRFDYLAQFLASRGYAVLQPNFRGSDGYGVAFRDAGDGEWAGKVLDDINGGTEQLIKDGIADPKRICIFGWSYGGYAALAAATFTPEHYACAASMAGVFDLQRDLDHTKRDYGEHSQALAIWQKRIGATIFDGAKLDARSPALHADQVRAPVLLMHSDKDVTVYIEQSEAEASALESAHKSVQFVKLEGDDHYLLQSETRIQMLKTLEAFLAAHIGT